MPPMIAAHSASFVQVNISPRRIRNPLLFRHQTTATDGSTSSLIQVSEQGDNNRCTQLYLRFSPLVGGPTFLPLHVEVIFVVDESEATITPLQTDRMDTVYIRSNKSFSSIPFIKDAEILHRFDFLPRNPTDPSTLARLFTFQSVPGVVRYRNVPQRDVDDRNISLTNHIGTTVLIPVGLLVIKRNSDEDDIVSTAIRFKEEYNDSLFKEIRILGGKNCFSFALDLVSYVESNTRLKRVSSWTKLDLK